MQDCRGLRQCHLEGQVAVCMLLRVLGAASTELWLADPEAEAVPSCPNTGHLDCLAFGLVTADAFDNDLMHRTLKNIVEGKTVEVPTYDFVTHSR